MALLEDILGMILLVFFLIIGGVMLAAQITSDQLSTVDDELTKYLFDYYSTSTNTFLNVREEISGVPIHIIIGDYISKGITVITGSDGRSVNVEDALEDILNEMYGEDNYYLQLRQDYTDTTISFVFDGSDSNREEKDTIRSNLQTIYNSINNIFEDSDAEVNINLYVLSEGPIDEVCDVFEDENRDICFVINSTTLYEDDMHLAVENTIGSLAGRQAVISHYLESDWVGGTIHAEKEFRRKVGREEITEDSLHIVIPVFDQLSTSSVPDDCFGISSGSGGFANYVVCRLCQPECPHERSARQQQDTINFFNERNRNSIIIPVFSFDCNFRYIYDWNYLDPSIAAYENYKSEPVSMPDTICHLDTCPGCRMPVQGERVIQSTNASEYINVCFKTDCQVHIENQMQELASGTGGTSINIEDVNNLAQQVIERIENVFEERELTIGVRQDERTRYVLERKIVLPSLGRVDVRLWVYELPDVDNNV